MNTITDASVTTYYPDRSHIYHVLSDIMGVSPPSRVRKQVGSDKHTTIGYFGILVVRELENLYASSNGRAIRCLLRPIVWLNNATGKFSALAKTKPPDLV